MAVQPEYALLNKVEAAFSADAHYLSHLEEFIMDLQGSGSQDLNTIVNDLVFLKRALVEATPDTRAIRSLVVSLNKKTTKASQRVTHPALMRLREALSSALRS